MTLAALRRYFLYLVSTKSVQRQDVYAFNQRLPVPQSTERLLDFLKKASYTKLHENLTTSFVVDTASLQTDVDSE
jgi:hypothetical protein